MWCEIRISFLSNIQRFLSLKRDFATKLNIKFLYLSFCLIQSFPNRDIALLFT